MLYLHLTSTIILSFFLILLFAKKRKTLPDRILAFWLLFLLENIVSIFLYEEQVGNVGLIMELSEASIFIHGPLLWFYAQALTRPDFHFTFSDGLHFVPFIVSLTMLWVYLGIDGVELPHTVRMTVLITKMSSMAIYVIFTLRRLFLYQREIPNYFSFTERIQLKWLQLLCGGSALLLSIGIISQLLFYVGKVDIPYYGGLYSNIGASIFAIVLAFYGVRQNHFLSKVGPPPREASVEREDLSSDGIELKAETENILLQKQYDRLLQFMESEKPYLDKDLTLFKLARLVGLHENQLSQVINTVAGRNFFDFVNGYRVEAVKKRIREGEYLEQTLLGIALDCGFNSKASFNRAFKKLTDLTPSEYRKQVEMA